MKTPAQKQRIREMLQAESLGAKNSDWAALKRQLKTEFLAVKIPRMEIVSADQGDESPPLQHMFSLRWLFPVFAVLLVVVGILVWRGKMPVNNNPQIAGVQKQVAPRTQALGKGDVFRSEKREIRFLGGNARLTETGDKIQIEATVLKADFRLGQKVDMQVLLPLVTITITGTRFTLDASAKQGTINLSEGRLRIDLKNSAGAGPVMLTAPVRFDFNEKSHRVKKAESSKDKMLYRYELVNGEVFFAHQLSKNARLHKVEILGGKMQQIPAEEILRFTLVENP